MFQPLPHPAHFSQQRTAWCREERQARWALQTLLKAPFLGTSSLVLELQFVICKKWGQSRTCPPEDIRVGVRPFVEGSGGERTPFLSGVCGGVWESDSCRWSQPRPGSPVRELAASGRCPHKSSSRPCLTASAFLTWTWGSQSPFPPLPMNLQQSGRRELPQTQNPI